MKLQKVPAGKLGDACEWCGKHIPAGRDKYVTEDGHVYCCKKCAREDS